MMHELKAESGPVDLYSIPMPESLRHKLVVEKRDMVTISTIEDEYYGKLGNTVALLWGKGKLMRRKYDYKGEFITDKNGNFIWKDVTCPNNCVAIVSDKSIGVPTDHKCSEPFEYVDMVTKEEAGKKIHKFVYIVPRKYCYKINQTALVLSFTKLRVYYFGVALAMQNGHTLYVYTIPYKPTQGTYHNYRILMSKPSLSYEEELAEIQKYWLENNIIFNASQCEMVEQVRGITNTAVQVQDTVLDSYIMFDPTKPLGELGSMEEENEFDE